MSSRFRIERTGILETHAAQHMGSTFGHQDGNQGLANKCVWNSEIVIPAYPLWILSGFNVSSLYLRNTLANLRYSQFLPAVQGTCRRSEAKAEGKQLKDGPSLFWWFAKKQEEHAADLADVFFTAVTPDPCRCHLNQK